MQTQAWMSKHRHQVSKKMKDDKEKQLEPLHRRIAAHQHAAEQEVAQVCGILQAIPCCLVDDPFCTNIACTHA